MRWMDIIFGRDKSNGEEQSPEAAMGKIREYVDGMPDMADVSEFRAATARAIAAHNEMKLDARLHRDQQLFDFLLPISEYFLKRITAGAFEAAQNKAVEVEMSICCKADSRSSFYYFEDRKTLSLTIAPKLAVNDVTYEFDSEKSQWQYFYQLVGWLGSELEGKGLTLSPITMYGRCHDDGWNDAMDAVSLRLRWGDDVFADAVKKFDDSSQVDAYLAGVPIEDIVV